ncbi:hypothetical protein NN561_006752 [Cricetulus griseus]
MRVWGAPRAMRPGKSEAVPVPRAFDVRDEPGHREGRNPADAVYLLGLRSGPLLPWLGGCCLSAWAALWPTTTRAPLILSIRELTPLLVDTTFSTTAPT